MSLALDCEQLIDDYVSWLRSKISIENLNGIVEITTPFLDSHNDRLQIYVKRDGRDQLRLSDDGYILSDLRASGCAMDTLHRQEVLNTILNGFGVSNTDGELTVRATLNDFPQKKHALLQAMMGVSDMFVLSKQHVFQIFVENVSHYLDEHKVRFSSNVSFVGKSGFHHRYDFLIPPSQLKPERIIRAINNPNRESVSSMVFSWNDTKVSRPPDALAIVFLNDTEREVSAEILTAFEKYEVTGIPWTKKDRHLDLLAA